MSKLGLVLAGGGGKGGYEIGVWKYLREIGLDERISVISGTSVGGLNAVLIGCGDYEKAERIWLTEIEGKILDTDSESHKSGAIFSREGLLQIIGKYIDLAQIQNSEKVIYVTCYDTGESQADYIKLNGRTSEEIKTYLLATSAIPVAFQKEKVNGRAYYDGGLKDNVPLKPLIDEGCTHALIVNLDKNYHVDYSGYDIKTVVLHPSIDLGSFASGTLDFSREGTEVRIHLGYDDCKRNSLRIKTLLNKNSQKEIEEMTEEEAVSKTGEINEMNDTAVLLETLKKICADPTLVGQLQVKMNWEVGTKGGKFFWKELAEFNGWRWQRNNVFGQVRLLDPLNNRKAWGDYQTVINVCKNFLSNEVKREFENSQKYKNAVK